MLGGYTTGTISIDANATVAIGTSVIWNSANAREGDTLIVDGHQVIVNSVNNVAELGIDAWPFAAVSGATYRLAYTSPLRYGANAQLAKDVSAVLAVLNATGFFMFVGIDEVNPDPSLGEDGQFALQPSTMKRWHKEGGLWVFEGYFGGFGIPAPYDNAHAYTLFEIATSGGSSYIWINPTPASGHAPPNATYWAVMAAKGADGASYGGSTPDTIPMAVGPLTFSTQSGLAYVVGSRIRISRQFDLGATYMEGTVTAYSDTSMTVNIARLVGSGTYIGWNLSIAGDLGATGASYGGSSTSSVAIGTVTGTRTFNVGTGTTYAYLPGDYVRAKSAANGANFVEGFISSYNPVTGDIVVSVMKVGGSGTLSDWNISLAGAPGTGDLLSTNNLSELTNKATARSNLGVPQTYGQCKLVKSGANLVLQPFNGNLLTIAGVTNAVPDAGVSLAATGLTAGTTYLIYAYMNAGTMTLEASITAHATSTTAGNKGTEIKSGDDTRTLVGMGRVITGAAWADSATQRFVASWFNRERRSAIGTTDSSSTENGTSSYAEKSISKAEFVCWADELVEPIVTGVINNSANTGAIGAVAFIDGASVGLAYDANPNQTAGRCPLTSSHSTKLTEGYHYVTFGMRAVGGGTASASYGIQAQAKIS